MLMTAIQIVRLLVFGDPDNATYTDAEVQSFLDLGSGSTLRAAGFMSSAASSLAASGASVRIGDWSQTSNASDLAKQSQAFFDMDANTPAFAVSQENVSQFAAWEMIRNAILRELA